MICSFFAYYKPTFVLLFCKQVFTKNMIWVSLWSWRLHFEGMQKQHARRHMMSYLQAYKSFLWFTALKKQNNKYYSPCEKKIISKWNDVWLYLYQNLSNRHIMKLEIYIHLFFMSPFLSIFEPQVFLSNYPTHKCCKR